MTQNNLSDIAQSLDQLNINDHTVRHTIEDLIEVRDVLPQSTEMIELKLFQGNIQRHRYFCDHLTQISTLLVSLLDHGNTIKEISSNSKSPTISNSSPTTLRRTKER